LLTLLTRYYIILHDIIIIIAKEHGILQKR